jgi:hypothetical protein
MQEVKHIVAVSGGKDSTAMLLRLFETERRDYIPVCTPTANEPEEMFAHWRKLGELIGRPILPIMENTLSGLIEQQRAIPNFRMRFCTRMLKIEPYARWLRGQGDCVSYVGLRADEPDREGGDYIDVPGVTQDFPLRRWGWGLADVLSYLEFRGVTIPKRTDCKLCFYQRLIEWWELWRNDPAGWAEGEAIEARRGATFRSPGRDTWPASMAGLRAEFEKGRVPKETRKDPLMCRVCRL